MLNIFSRCTYFFKALCLIFILFLGSRGQRWPKFFSLCNLFCWVLCFMYQSVLWLLYWEHNALHKVSERAQGHTKSVQTTRLSEFGSGHLPEHSSETRILWPALGICPCVTLEAEIWNSYDVAVTTEYIYFYALCSCFCSLRVFDFSQCLGMLEWLSCSLCYMFSWFFSQVVVFRKFDSTSEIESPRSSVALFS